MPEEDSLPRRARRVRSRYLEAVDRRLGDLERLVDKLEAAGDKEGVGVAEGRAEQELKQELEHWREGKAELEAIAEELDMVSAEASIEGAKLRADAQASRRRESEEARARRRAERRNKARDRQMLVEARKQTKAAKDHTKEEKRKRRRGQ